MTGGTDKVLRVYNCIPGPPVLVAEVSGHTVRYNNIVIERLNMTVD